MKAAGVVIDGYPQPADWEILHNMLASLSDESIIICPQEMAPMSGIPHRSIAPANELCMLKEALVWAQGDPLLLVAGDITSPSAELARYMDYVRAGFDAVVPMIDEETAEPLFGLYTGDCMNEINSALIAGQQFTITEILPQLAVRYLDRAEIIKFGEPEHILARS